MKPNQLEISDRPKHAYVSQQMRRRNFLSGMIFFIPMISSNQTAVLGKLMFRTGCGNDLKQWLWQRSYRTTLRLRLSPQPQAGINEDKDEHTQTIDGWVFTNSEIKEAIS